MSERPVYLFVCVYECSTLLISVVIRGKLTQCMFVYGQLDVPSLGTFIRKPVYINCKPLLFWSMGKLYKVAVIVINIMDMICKILHLECQV